MNILVLGPHPRNKAVIRFLRDKGNHVTVTDHKIDLVFMRQNKIDYGVINGYAPIIKEPVISQYRHRIVNIHATYLPFGRGIYGNFWSFFEDTPKGVSIMFIDEGIDTGDIIARKQVHLDLNETLKTSWDILYREVEDLFFQTWDQIINQTVCPISQSKIDESGSYHSRRKSEKFIARLPQKWDTPLHEVEKMGRLYRESRQLFRETYPIAE